jgi:hypothetical protein
MEHDVSHPDERTPMSTTTTSLRELAHRAHNGLEVTLLWDPRADDVLIDIIDEHIGSSFLYAVPRDAALDAFHHPYVYAPAWLELDPAPVCEVAVTE